MVLESRSVNQLHWITRKVCQWGLTPLDNPGLASLSSLVGGIWRVTCSLCHTRWYLHVAEIMTQYFRCLLFNVLKVISKRRMITNEHPNLLLKWIHAAWIPNFMSCRAILRWMHGQCPCLDPLPIELLTYIVYFQQCLSLCDKLYDHPPYASAYDCTARLF